MNRVAQSLLDRLDLAACLDEELAAPRNQIPPEPWLTSVAAHLTETLRWIRSRLAQGAVALPASVVNVRKATTGTRPVPILGIADRVAYRALTKLAMGDLPQVDRSPAAYREFLRGPIDYALAGWSGAGALRLDSLHVKYVVEADIVAFYQFVDHEQLRHQLELHGGDVEAIDLLMELLVEVQGRTFGLPQLLDPSDWLSDIYIQALERDLLRRGLDLWRYNDDFRIACASYTDALDAIERLEEAARLLGLTVSDYKTRTPSFATYFFRTTGLNISQALADLDPSDVEVVVTDYPNLDEEEQIDAAIATLGRIDADSDDDSRIDLHRLSTEVVRDLRRALGALTAGVNPAALSRLLDLVVLVPSLTPRVCEYLLALRRSDHAQEVQSVFDTIIGRVSLGEWQAMWLAYVARELNLLSNEPTRISWLEEQLERGRGSALAAEAALALSLAGRVEFDDLDSALRTEPEALAPWYLLAMRPHAGAHGDRVRAVRDSHPLNGILLGS